MRSLLSILTSLTAAPAILLAVEANMAFRHLSVTEGLSQSTVRAIEGDALGNIWFGTQNGLNMYDGYGFTVYYRNSSDSTSLADNSIYALKLSSSGKLWIGTAKGLSCRDFREGRFVNYALPSGDQHVVDIFESFGTLYISTDGGLISFDEESGCFKTIDALKDLKNIRSVKMSDAGLLIATKNGLHVFNRGGNVSLVEVQSLKGLDISCIEPISTGYWVGTHGGGLFRTDKDFNVVRHFNSRGRSHVPSDYIRTMKLDSYGRLWIGTYDGLAIYDDLSGEFSAYTHSSRYNSLSHNSVWSIYMDRQGGVWIGTYYGGVNWWNSQGSKFRLVNLGESDGKETYGYVSCLTSVGSSVWAGTNDDGLFRYDPSDGSLVRYCSGNVSASGGAMADNIKCILEEPGGELYVGTHLGGLLRLNPRTLEAKVYELDNKYPVYNGCYSLLDNGDGSLLVGSTYGLFLFDKKTGTFSPHEAATKDKKIAARLVNKLFRCSDSTILIGTDSGLYGLSADGSALWDYSETDKRISGVYVYALMQDSSGVIWIGTNAGLFRMTEGNMTLYTVSDGLPNDYVFGILEDGSKALWISTGNGLCSLDKTRTVFKRHGFFGDPDHNEFTQGACCALEDGAFVFGGLKGLTLFRPLDIFDSPWIPRPYVYDISVFYGQVEPGGRFDVRRDGSGKVTGADVSVKNNIFSIKFTVPNPLSEGRNAFSYRLEGFDENWFETTSREITYSNIPPGKYEFHLKAANNDGLWSKEGDAVVIHVLPRWWQTRFASILWFILIIVLVNYALRRLILYKTRQAAPAALSDKQGEDQADENEFLSRAKEIVLKNIGNPDFSSDDFAAALYMSRSNLYLKLKEAGDESATQFIRKIRLERACELLKEQKLSVSEISEQVGFGSPSYFATTFKKYIGCLPSEYVKPKNSR